MNNPQDPAVTLRDVFRARHAIDKIARNTPLVPSPELSRRTGSSVHLKLECLQDIGAFKVRGAANKILNLSDEEKRRGVVTVSTGNHGRAVAYVANRLGIRAVICLSDRVPENKVVALRRLGAEVVIHGHSQDEAEMRAIQLEREQGLVMISPFDDPYVIAGQGTIGLELLEDLPEIDTAVVPLSGGGLISGIGLALKSANPEICVVGVSMERGPVMVHSIRAGHPVQIPEEDTLADCLQGGIGVDNRYTFRMVQDLVDEMVLVSEEQIAMGMVFALKEHHLVVEGGGAVGLAALLSGKVANMGDHVAVIVSGANVALETVLAVAQRYPEA